jgi:1-pyrroline-5-carboxylate dehydrogenase
MSETNTLPRVTYSNLGEDFSGVHAHIDAILPTIKGEILGRTYVNLINGRDDTEGTPYTAPSPIDRDVVLGSFIAATPGAVDRAVRAAKAAARDWGRRPWQERIAILRAGAKVMDQRKYTLSIAAIWEVGKSRMEAIGEVEEAVDLILHYCLEMERNNGFDRPMERAFQHEATRCVLKPHGAFGVIAPFNFPVALSTGMMSAAMAAGNTVVYKPSPEAGLTGRMVVDCFIEGGLPAGVLNMVCGGADVGSAIVDHEAIDGIAFTGSNAVGMAIHRRFAESQRARPVLAEMGGKNPTYVTARADIDTAAAGVMRSAFGLQGQKCSALSKVYVHEDIHDSFLGRLVEMTEAITIGNPEDQPVFMGPVINGGTLERFNRACDSVRQRGAFATGGEGLSGGIFDKGCYVRPTIATGLPADHYLNKEEQFMPFLTVQTFRDLDSAIRDGNDVLFGLTAGIYTEDARELNTFLDSAEAGVLYANRASGATTGAWPDIQTFCGWKGSGLTGKGGLGPWYVPQFMREQSHTLMGRP